MKGLSQPSEIPVRFHVPPLVALVAARNAGGWSDVPAYDVAREGVDKGAYLELAWLSDRRAAGEGCGRM